MRAPTRAAMPPAGPSPSWPAPGCCHGSRPHSAEYLPRLSLPSPLLLLRTAKARVLRIRQIDPPPGDGADSRPLPETQRLERRELRRQAEEPCPEAKLPQNHVGNHVVLAIGFGAEIVDPADRAAGGGAHHSSEQMFQANFASRHNHAPGMCRRM